MKTHLYSGWLVADCNELCLSLCPPAGNNNEAPALANLISCNFETGDQVFLWYSVYPELLQRMFIGQLSLRGLRVGCYDIVAELGVHLGKFVVVLVAAKRNGK
jgi:hypothetical protein